MSEARRMNDLKCYRCGEWDGERCGCRDGQTIFWGDCREILPLLPKVDLVLTDPPYQLDIAQGNKGCFAKSYSKLTSTPLQQIASSYDIQFLCAQICKLTDPRNCFVFCSNRQIPALMNQLYIFNISPTVIVWNKYNSVPFSHGTWRQDAEFIIHGKSSGAPLNGDADRKRKIKTYPINGTKHGHPTEKPLRLISELVSIGSHEGQLILDPYLGSGTTLLAAKQSGRRGIGIEISEDYCRVAASRLRQEVLF